MLTEDQPSKWQARSVEAKDHAMPRNPRYPLPLGIPWELRFESTMEALGSGPTMASQVWWWSGEVQRGWIFHADRVERHPGTFRVSLCIVKICKKRWRNFIEFLNAYQATLDSLCPCRLGCSPPAAPHLQGQATLLKPFFNWFGSFLNSREEKPGIKLRNIHLAPSGHFRFANSQVLTLQIPRAAVEYSVFNAIFSLVFTYL